MAKKPLFALAGLAMLLVILQVCGPVTSPTPDQSPSAVTSAGASLTPTPEQSPSVSTSSDCRTISTRGEYTLTTDIVTGQDVCIKFEAGAGGSTFDCQGHSITSTAGSYASQGILLDYVDAVTVRNCVIRNFGTGIYLGGASNSIIASNTVSNATWGIRLTATPVGSEAAGTLRSVHSDHNTIRSNQLTGNNYGIELRYANNNLVEGNNADNSRSTGFDIELADNNTIRNNRASNSYTGIYLEEASGNILENNVATDNSADYDIDCISSDSNSASGNACQYTSCDWVTSCVAPT